MIGMLYVTNMSHITQGNVWHAVCHVTQTVMFGMLCVTDMKDITQREMKRRRVMSG